MIKKITFKAFLTAAFIVCFFASGSLQAAQQKLIMGRSLEAFPETMSILQDEIKKAGYTVSIVQRVDIGLTGMGFQTDKYRVVFFGKPEEIKSLPKKYPKLTPYLPLAIAIFAEENETILTAMSPHFIEKTFTSNTDELHEIFERWHRDIQLIIERVSNHE